MTHRFFRFLMFGFGLLANVLANPAGDSDEAPPAVDLKSLTKNGKKPKGIKQGPPTYPQDMMRAGIVGSVTISFIIDKAGDVRNAYVLESNNPWFERPALDAVTKWKFSPGEMDGRPVHTRVMQRIDFNLEPGGRTLELWKVTKGKDHAAQPPEFQWDQPPEPKMTLFPVYPFDQLKAGTPGKARVAYVVGPTGTVIATKLLEATAPEFGAAVLAMIDGWRFKPATLKNGKPALARLATEYEFRPTGRGDVPVSDEARAILRQVEKKPETIVVTLKELDRPLKPLSQRPPIYPTAMAKADQPGEALVEFYIDKSGDVQLPRIVSGSAPEFGYAAVQAIATWRFEPARKGGKAVVVRTQIPVGFGARGESGAP